MLSLWKIIRCSYLTLSTQCIRCCAQEFTPITFTYSFQQPSEAGIITSNLHMKKLRPWMVEYLVRSHLVAELANESLLNLIPTMQERGNVWSSSKDGKWSAVGTRWSPGCSVWGCRIAREECHWYKIILNGTSPSSPKFPPLPWALSC